MKIPDVNVLMYAANEAVPQHDACRKWLEGALGGGEPVGFAWHVLLAFVRLSTRTGLLPSALTIDRAFEYVDIIVTQPASVLIGPTDRHPMLLRDLLKRVGTAGNLVSDAHLAALAIEHGAQIVSCDRDFERFPGITRIDPTAA